MSTDEEAGQGVGIQCQTMQQDVRWGDQQWRQEVKIAPASRPDPQSPIPGRALGSAPGAILGPGRVILPGGRSPPTPRAGRLAADRGGRACSCSAAAARSRFTDSAAPPRSFILQLIHSEGSGRLRLGPIPRRRSVRQFISGRVQCVSGREGAREARFS